MAKNKQIHIVNKTDKKLQNMKIVAINSKYCKCVKVEMCLTG